LLKIAVIGQRRLTAWVVECSPARTGILPTDYHFAYINEMASPSKIKNGDVQW
jgi:hypothetical protein